MALKSPSITVQKAPKPPSWSASFKVVAQGRTSLASTEIKPFVESIERPRKIMMMIRAGKPVDYVIESLLPHLEPGDIVIDGGNSNWEDSERREAGAT